MEQNKFNFCNFKGGRNVDHLKQNIEALALELNSEEIAEIEGAVPFDLGFPHVMLWGEKAPENRQQVWLVNMGGQFDYVPEPKVRANPRSSS